MKIILQVNGIYAYCSGKGGFFDYIQFGFLETPVLKFDLEVIRNHSNMKFDLGVGGNHSNMKFDLEVGGNHSNMKFGL